MAKHFTVHHPILADKVYGRGDKIPASKLSADNLKTLLGSGHIKAVDAKEESAPKASAPTEEELQAQTKQQLVDLAKKKLKITLDARLTKDEMVSAIIAAFEADDDATQE